jgi:DNA-damage-inducible protein D
MVDLKIVVFNDRTIRRIFHNNEWWFAVSDVVTILTDSVDVKQYIKRMRSRDQQLDSNWGTICTPLEMVNKLNDSASTCLGKKFHESFQY